MLHYRTNHPNHVHQLIITASKHFYLSSENILKYQAKEINVSLNSIEKSKKRNMLIYSIRDHCSGVFYSELSFAPDIIRPQDFLSRAWGTKPDFDFRGIPRELTIPATLQKRFPDLIPDISELGINLIDVTSGFQSGVRDIRTIELSLRVSANRDVSDAFNWVKRVFQGNAKEKSRLKEISKIELWASGVPEIVLPPVGWGQKKPR